MLKIITITQTFACIFFTFTLLVIPVFAYQTNSLQIIVTDQNGDFIPNKNIRLKRSTKTISEVISSNNESDSFTSIELGKYTLEIEAKGFKTYLQEIEIKSGKNDFFTRLEISDIVENVNVVKENQDKALDSQNGAFSNFLNKEQLEDLPDNPDELEKSLKNQFGQDAVIRVDGFSAKVPPKAQIASIRVTRSTFDAEYHQLGFTFIDIISKAGGGKFTGSVYFDFNDESFNGRPSFASARFPTQHRNFNAFFSGPIIKNKTSVFGIISGENSYKQENIFAIVPSGRINTSVQNSFSTFSSDIKISHNAGKGNTFNTSYSGNIRNVSNQGVGGFDLPERAFSVKSVGNEIRISQSRYLGKRFLNEIRLQYVSEKIETTPDNNQTTIIVLNSFNGGGAGNFSQSHRHNFSLSDNLLFGVGRIHALKIGGLLEYEHQNLISAENENGTFIFSDLVDFQNNRPLIFTQSLGTRETKVSQFQIGAYIQDDIRIDRSFLLSFGLRYEWQNNLKDHNNVSPRVGFIWSPYKNGKLSLRGGAGAYYNWMETSTRATVFSQGILQQPEIVIIDPSYPNPLSAGASQILPQSFRQLSPDLKNPLVFVSSIGIEGQLNKGINLRVLYKFQKSVDNFRSRDINAPINFIRPDANYGRVIQVESTALFAQNALSVELNGKLRKNLSLTTIYTLSKTISDNKEIFDLPSDSYNLQVDRSASHLDQRHRINASVFWRISNNLNLSTNLVVASPTPYTITTGVDNNGDTTFNDRPLGLERNSERGTWQRQVDNSLNWKLGFGERKAEKGGIQSMIAVSPSESGDISVDTKHKYTLKFSIKTYNIFNWTNFLNFVGTQSSPFFRRPLASASARRIVLGMRFNF